MSLKKDIVTTGFVQVIRRIVLGFAGTLVLTRWLGPERLGLYTAFMVVPLILKSLGELGIRQSAAYLTGKQIVAERHMVGVLVFIWVLGAVISLSLVLIAYHLQGMHTQSLACVALGVTLVPAGLVARYANGVALGKRWIARINIAETVHIVVRVALLAALIIGLRAGVSGALGAELIAAVAPGALMLYWLRRDLHVSFMPVWDRQLTGSLIAHGFKFALALFVLTLNYRASLLILQRFVGHADLGQFALGIKIAELIWMAPAAVGMVMFSHSTAARDSRRFAETTSQVMRFTLLFCGGCAVCLTLFCDRFVSLLFGPEYLASVPVIRAMLPGCVAAVVFKVLNADLAGRGRPLTAMWVYLGALGVNVLASLAFIPRYGAFGAALASSVSYVLGAVVFAAVYAQVSDVTLVQMFCRPHRDWATVRQTVRRFWNARMTKGVPEMGV